MVLDPNLTEVFEGICDLTPSMVTRICHIGAIYIGEHISSKRNLSNFSLSCSLPEMNRKNDSETFKHS